ncbi:M23 family metallopeptidase [Rossellomorea aquimaris]|uniref:M23 family metallopeptidase n=1 Tax=Rossellomorea aquimaris TaxID=189382 RepID=UPI001CD36293|nr:M23 family metallopeptidase [Rossellomorea aquimaris]MCA1057471.1 M23 family metallopeptidase [Rossellomorea aquimaris]
MMIKTIFKSLISFILLIAVVGMASPINKASAASSFIYPLNGTITTNFGPDVLNNEERYHYGIDIDGNIGDAVKSSASGTVVRSDYSSSYGNVIIVRHSINNQTYETLYAHLNSRNVSNGSTVNQGQVIGAVGNTGYSFGSHLHFELHKGTWNINKSNAVDPLEYLGKDLVPATDNYAVYVRTANKEGELLNKFSTIEEATKEMNKYNYTSIINLSTGLEIATNNAPKDVKVYFGSDTEGTAYAEFSTKLSARNFLDMYQNMVAVDTATWDQFDWSVANSKKYGAFNGSDSTRKDFGVRSAAIDYLETNYTNSVVMDKTTKPYPTEIWKSNNTFPKKYLVTDGNNSQSYSIYSAAVYARDLVPGSEIIIQ